MPVIFAISVHIIYVKNKATANKIKDRNLLFLYIRNIIPTVKVNIPK